MRQEIHQTKATDPVLFETCPNCQGLGRAESKFTIWIYECPQCKGSGLIQEIE